MTEQADPIARAYRMRVYPTAQQARELARLSGAARHVWNWALEQRTDAWRERRERINWIGLSRLLTEYRRRSDRLWLASLPREPFDQVLRDQERAFTNFFAKRSAYPRFKRRGGHSAVRFTLDQRREQVRADDGRWARISLPGLGQIRVRRTELLLGRLRSVTMTHDGAGRWHASVTADRVMRPPAVPARMLAIGLDAGLNSMLVAVSDAATRTVPAPKALSSKLAKLRRYQRRQSRQIAAQLRSQGFDPKRPCPKGVRLAVSGRRRRNQQRIARLHARITDMRRDALHQASASVVREAQVIGIEDLAVKAMARSMGRPAFRRSVADAGLGELRRQLTYKAAWFGRALVVVDRWFPSSKTCSGCGVINTALTLRERRWVCETCGAEHDRDVNAAKNIRTEALRILAELSPATPRSGGSDAREEDAAAAGSASPAGLSTSPKRELTVAGRRTGLRSVSGDRSAKTRMKRAKADQGETPIDLLAIE